MHQDTKCVHHGGLPDAATGGVNSPVYLSTATEYLDRDRVPYQRYFNTPNQAAVVGKVAALERAEDGVLFGPGMAAISTTLLTLLRSGDHAVLQAELYGGTHSFVADLFTRLGIAFDFAPMTPEAIAAATTPQTKVIFLESPTNHLLPGPDVARENARFRPQPPRDHRRPAPRVRRDRACRRSGRRSRAGAGLSGSAANNPRLPSGGSRLLSPQVPKP